MSSHGPKQALFEQFALIARTLGHPHRLDLLEQLAQGERTVEQLADKTGLSITAARTTGPVAHAKWGRVVMISPRAAPKGYGFLDTLAHELSHLAQTRASKDLAPLWLQ